MCCNPFPTCVIDAISCFTVACLYQLVKTYNIIKGDFFGHVMIFDVKWDNLKNFNETYRAKRQNTAAFTKIWKKRRIKLGITLVWIENPRLPL